MKNRKNILITGITGQDGIFLTENLIRNNPDGIIYGFTRNHKNNTFFSNLEYLNKELNYENIRLLDSAYINGEGLSDLIKEIEPNYIFNMSGPSSVYDSIKTPELSEEIEKIFNNLIQACISLNLFPGFFQASSSEMYGLNKEKTLSETSDFKPSSPYAIAKYNIHKRIEELREEYNWNVVSGIMFNHESEFRKDEYLFMKIINYAIKARNGKQKGNLLLGSLELKRDWSYAGDIAEAAILILKNNSKSDFVLGSGTTNSIEEVVSMTFNYFNLDWKNFVEIDKSLLRAEDPIERISNPVKIKNELGWETKIKMSEIIEKIIKFKLDMLNGL